MKRSILRGALSLKKDLTLELDKWNIYKWNGIFMNGIFPAISINKGCHSHQ